ncbi:hypothetical protein Tco_0880058 [Tanacetum coccineum]
MRQIWLRNAGKARFAFETLHQRIQVRKFPAIIIVLFLILALHDRKIFNGEDASGSKEIQISRLCVTCCTAVLPAQGQDELHVDIDVRSVWTLLTDSLDDYQEYKTPYRVRDQLWMMIKFRMDHGICLHMYLFWNMSFDYRFRQVFVLFFPCHVFSHWVLHDEVFKEANLFRLLLGHFLCLKVKNGSWNELLKLLAAEEL